MKNPKKLSRIKLLMITSHLLLTLFVMQWVVTRYSEEKVALKKELDREFQATENRMLDSLLLVKVVNPFLQSNRRPQIQMFITSDSGRHNAIGGDNAIIFKDTSDYKAFGINNETPDSIRVSIGNNTRRKAKSIKISSNIYVDSVKSTDLREKFLIQSIKVLNDNVSDSSKNGRSITLKFTTGVDSSFVRSDFEKNPLACNFKLNWNNKDSNENKSGLRLETRIPESSMSVDVLHYQFYLLKKITPQIVFGLILILLTGIAFITSFVSLKKQVGLNKIRNDFVANISHELKTPVATVKVALEALQSFNVKNEPVQADEYIRIAQLEMNRLDMLIQNVLTSAVYDEAHELMQFEIISIQGIVNEVVQSMQIRLKQINTELTINAESFDTKILADRLHIQGVLINLIDNSIKYVEGNPQIAIKIFEENNKVILTVSDNGIGIPEEYLSKVFDKFFRVPSENRHNVKGYGLGLSYAAMVMKQHKGEISVENVKEGGCCFKLTFRKNL